MIETIIFFIVIGTILYWLMPLLLPVAIVVGIISFIITISESKISNNKRNIDFSSELGKTMMEKDMIDSMFGNKELDELEKTIITKNVIDNIK